MGIWKTLGYAAGGVCAVVALPVFGAVGTVTAVGAAIGASVGAAVGAVVGDDEAPIRAAEDHGRNQEKARFDFELQALRKQYEEAIQHYAKSGDYFKLVEALFTVGMACARECGRTSDADVQNLMEFIVGLSHQALPRRLNAKLETLKEEPPTLRNAYKRAEKLAPNAGEMLDQVVELAAHGIEGNTCRTNWAKLRAA